jgi:hypothetical protein
MNPRWTTMERWLKQTTADEPWNGIDSVKISDGAEVVYMGQEPSGGVGLSSVGAVGGSSASQKQR